MRGKFFGLVCFLIAGSMFNGIAIAKTLDLPINFDSRFLTHLLQESVFNNQQGLSVWGDEEGCNDLTLSNPRVIVEPGKMTILTDAKARTGWIIGDRCVGLLQWQGSIQAIQKAEVKDPRGLISFSTIDTELLDRNGKRSGTSNWLWNLVKDNVHPQLDKLSIDLTKAMDEIRQLLPLFFSRDDLRSGQKLVDSFNLYALETTIDALIAVVSFEIDILPAEHDSPGEQALSEPEIQQVIETWERWDAFLGFVVKIAARNVVDREMREVLLDALIETRYALVEVLSDPDSPDVDPVRKSFIKTWHQLAPIFRQISVDISGRESLRFLGFITAVDALNAVDSLGPVTGWDVTVDGLRRLARMLITDPDVDPLEINPEVDAEMRALFDFGPAIDLPELPADTTDEPVNTPIEKPVDDAPAPPGLSWHNWLLPDAFASTARRNKAEDLDQIVPDQTNISVYLSLIKDLLQETVNNTLQTHPLASDFHQLYHDLVLTTAWQETCWRQYQRRNGKIKTITSSAGALGMMQIMPKVWRGFYDTESLGNSIAYNAAAGSEILHRYLVRYAIRKEEHKLEGGTDNLVRASYAAYNGGPSHLGRYRRASTANSLQKIDRGFWEKFLQIRQGDEMAVKQCYPYS